MSSRLNESAEPPAEDVDAWSDEEEEDGEGRGAGHSSAAGGADGLVCCLALMLTKPVCNKPMACKSIHRTHMRV